MLDVAVAGTLKCQSTLPRGQISALGLPIKLASPKLPFVGGLVASIRGCGARPGRPLGTVTDARLPSNLSFPNADAPMGRGGMIGLEAAADRLVFPRGFPRYPWGFLQ